MAEARIKRNKPSKPKSKSSSFEIFKDEKGYYGLNGFDKLPDEQRRVDLSPEEIRSYQEKGLIKNPDIFKDDPQFQDIWAGDQHENLKADVVPAADVAPAAEEAPKAKDIDEPEVDDIDKEGPFVDAQKAQDEFIKEQNAKAEAHEAEKNRPQTNQEIIEGAVRGRRTDLVIPRKGGSGSTMPNLPALKHNADLDYRAKKMREQALEDESEFNRREKIIAGKYDESMGYGAFANLSDAGKAAARQSYGASGVRSVNNENNRRQQNLINKGLLEDTPEARMREAIPKAPIDLRNEGYAMDGKLTPERQQFEDQQDAAVTAELNKRAKAGEDVAQVGDPDKGIPGYVPPWDYQRPPADLDNPETVQEGTMGPYADFNSPARQRLREEKVGPFPKEEPRGRGPEKLRPWVKDMFGIEDPAPTPAPEPISELPPQDPLAEEPSEDFDPSMSENLTPFIDQSTTAPQDKGFLPPQLQPGYEPDMSKPVTQQIREGVNLQPTMMPDGSVKQQIPNQSTYLAPEYQKPDPSSGLTSLGFPKGGDVVNNIPTLEEDGQIVPKGQMPTPDGVSKLPYGPTKASLEDPEPKAAPAPAPAQPQAPAQAPAPAPAPSIEKSEVKPTPFQTMMENRSHSAPEGRARPITQTEMLFNSIRDHYGRNGVDIEGANSPGMEKARRDFTLMQNQWKNMHPAEKDNFITSKILSHNTDDPNPLTGKQEDINHYTGKRDLDNMGWKDQMRATGFGVEKPKNNRLKNILNPF